LDILFSSNKMEEECCDAKVRRRRHGDERAKRLGRRLDDLRAAENLAVMRGLPGDCHELTGDRKGLIAISLDGPYRLVMEPVGDPLPRNESGGLLWSRITAVRVLRIEDYHNG
jgi:plasmid maintenance system killer protein